MGGSPGAAPTPTYMASFWLRASARLLLLSPQLGPALGSTQLKTTCLHMDN